MLNREKRDWLRWLAADLYKSDEVQLGERRDLGDLCAKHVPELLDALEEMEREREAAFAFARRHGVTCFDVDGRIVAV